MSTAREIVTAIWMALLFSFPLVILATGETLYGAAMAAAAWIGYSLDCRMARTLRQRRRRAQRPQRSQRSARRPQRRR